MEKADVQRLSPTMQAHFKLLLASASHWPEQVTWPFPSLMVREVCSAHRDRENGVGICRTIVQVITRLLSVMVKSQANMGSHSEPNQLCEFRQVAFPLCASVSPPENQISSGITH